MNKWIQLIGSRKFWAAVVGMVLVVIRTAFPDFPLEDESLIGMLSVLAAYILGVAIEDNGLHRKSL
jgi:uncharacterized membrane protein YdjX (TVP38/TMEM64 family)